MRHLNLPIRCCAMVLVVLGASCNDGRLVGPGDRCEGTVQIDIGPSPLLEGGPLQATSVLSVGPLLCNGVCNDGTRCTPQGKDIEDAGDGVIRREWCGCPGEPEPERCHFVRLIVRSANSSFPDTKCVGSCPVQTDQCVIFKRDLPPPADPSLPPGGRRSRFQEQCGCFKL